MKTNLEKFGIKYNKIIPVDKFIEKILYASNFGYYNCKIPFGKNGDFITAPTISNLFSEIIAIWIVSTWENFDKPKRFNLIELGPGDGSLSKVLIETFKKFPEFNSAVNIYLYEKSNLLIKTQKKKINGKNIHWIKNFEKINNGPVIFFGNEFFDAVPIKQFIKKKSMFFELCYKANEKELCQKYRMATKVDIKKIKSFRTLNNLKFIEYPKLGFKELDKIVKKITTHNGGILLIDYGHLNVINKSTLQAVMKNKKINMYNLIKNLGKADVTSLVNFNLLKEYFLKKNLKVKKIVSQKFFLEKMGIIERAKILEKKMTNNQKVYLSATLDRLLNKKLMGELFKVVFAFKFHKSSFLGFE